MPLLAELVPAMIGFLLSLFKLNSNQFHLEQVGTSQQAVQCTQVYTYFNIRQLLNSTVVKHVIHWAVSKQPLKVPLVLHHMNIETIHHRCFLGNNDTTLVGIYKVLCPCLLLPYSNCTKK